VNIGTGFFEKPGVRVSGLYQERFGRSQAVEVGWLVWIETRFSVNWSLKSGNAAPPVMAGILCEPIEFGLTIATHRMPAITRASAIPDSRMDYGAKYRQGRYT
jgi:hypothetical protein